MHEMLWTGVVIEQLVETKKLLDLHPLMSAQL